MSTTLERQNRVIIELLARTALGVEKIEDIVKKGKRKGNPDDYAKVYNLLDGTKTATELAKVVQVSKQNMSEILKYWEEKGIVYNIGTDNLPKYVGLLRLPINNKGGSQAKKGKEESPADDVIPEETRIKESAIEASNTSESSGSSELPGSSLEDKE